MTVVLYLGIFMMPAQMKMNLLYMLGSMMFGERNMIYMSGAMMHAVNSIAFALAHVAIYQAFDLDSNLAGLGPGLWGGPLGCQRHGVGHDANDASRYQGRNHAGPRRLRHVISHGYGDGFLDAPPDVRSAGGSVLRRLWRRIAAAVVPCGPVVPRGHRSSALIYRGAYFVTKTVAF